MHESKERLSPDEDLAPHQKNSINTLRVTFLCSSEEANGPVLLQIQAASETQPACSPAPAGSAEMPLRKDI